MLGDGSHRFFMMLAGIEILYEAVCSLYDYSVTTFSKSKNNNKSNNKNQWMVLYYKMLAKE